MKTHLPPVLPHKKVVKIILERVFGSIAFSVFEDRCHKRSPQVSRDDAISECRAVDKSECVAS